MKTCPCGNPTFSSTSKYCLDCKVDHIEEYSNRSSRENAKRKRMIQKSLEETGRYEDNDVIIH